MKRIVSLFLAGTMIFGMLPQSVLATEVQEPAEIVCSHQHDDSCYAEECTHVHDDSCGYSEAAVEAEPEAAVEAESVPPVETEGGTDVEATVAPDGENEVIVDASDDVSGDVDQGSCGANLTWSFDKTTGILTISGTGEMHAYDHDDGEYTPWYSLRESITSLVVEDGVTTIGNYAFATCKNLAEVSIADSVESFGAYAFQGCNSLKAIEIPEGQSRIWAFTFAGCSSLTSITIPDGVSTIEANAFSGSGITSITIPDSVSSIGNRAFDGSDLVEVRIGKSVRSLGARAFAFCSSLKSVWFTGNAPETGEANVFFMSSGKVYYPDHLDSWTESARACICRDASWASYNVCENGHSYDANNTCTNCGAVKPFDGGQCGDNVFWTYDGQGTLTITGTGAMEDYPSVLVNGVPEDVAPWYSYEVKQAIILDGVTHIGKSAFQEQAQLTSVELPESLTSIGTLAFCGCSSLTSVTLPESITELGISAFLSCEKLSSINIPGNITVISDFAFAHCSSLSDVTIPAGVTRIGDNAFLYSGLTSIRIPEKVTSLGGSAFEGCSNLTKIEFTGNAPEFITSEPNADPTDSTFYGVTATAYYPAGNATWTSAVMQDYGGTITWVPDGGSTAPAGIPVDAANFPDAKFRAWILEQDYGTDAVLTPEEVAAVGSIDVPYMEIADLTGIEHFTALSILGCTGNQISALDVSNNTALTYLDCGSNLLTELDVSRNTELETLYCYDNQLSSLDLQNNTSLMHLNINSNRLTALEVAHLVDLEEIGCDNNQLTQLDVSRNTKLDYLGCSLNQLTELDISSNTVLRVLHCDGNQLSVLDITNQPELEYLTCAGNQLTKLDVSQNLKLGNLECAENQLSALDISSNTLLVSLSCSFNQLTELDIRKNTALVNLNCVENQLTALDLSCNPALEYVDCGGNQITELDVSHNTALKTLGFSGNRLTEIDVQHNTLLEQINCSTNQLTALDLSSNPNCSEVYGNGNNRTITLNGQNQFDLSSLPGFDVSKASDWTNAAVTNQTLTAEGRNITYSYQAGNGISVSFALKAENYVPQEVTNGVCGENLTWEFDEETGILTIKGTGPMYEYADGYVDGKTTPPWAEGERDRIKHVVIEEGVTTISDAAFCGFEKIQSVSIADTVESIGGIAFEYCYSLESIILPDRVTSIGVSAFLDCRQLSSVVIGSEIETIGGFAFGACPSLKTITFSGNAPSFGNYPHDVFYNVTATAYYPADNATWTAEVMQNYGGTITWEAYCLNHTFGDWITEGSNSRRTCTLCGYTEYKVVTDSGDVEIEIPEQPDLEVEVEPVLPSEDNYVLVEEALEGADSDDQSILKVFDISLKNDDGVHVQPSGTVTVKLPLDEDQNGTYKVYRVNADGTLTDMNAIRQGSHMVFETDHFSLYVMVHSHNYVDGVCTDCGAKDPEAVTEVTVTPSTGNTEIACEIDGQIVTVTHTVPCKVGYLLDGAYVAVEAVANTDGSYSFTVPEGITEVTLVVKGDVNGDGKMNNTDKARLNAYLLNKNVVLSEANLFASDVTGDGKPNNTDKARMNAVLLNKTALVW